MCGPAGCHLVNALKSKKCLFYFILLFFKKVKMQTYNGMEMKVCNVAVDSTLNIFHTFLVFNFSARSVTVDMPGVYS